MSRHGMLVYQPQANQDTPQVEQKWDSPEFQKVTKA